MPARHPWDERSERDRRLQRIESSRDRVECLVAWNGRPAAEGRTTIVSSRGLFLQSQDLRRTDTVMAPTSTGVAAMTTPQLSVRQMGPTFARGLARQTRDELEAPARHLFDDA